MLIHSVGDESHESEGHLQRKASALNYSPSKESAQPKFEHRRIQMEVQGVLRKLAAHTCLL